MKALAEYLMDLELLNKEINEEFSTLDKNILNWKPSSKKWSIGQCLEHLILTTQSYQATFNSILSTSYSPSLWARISPFTNYLGVQMIRTQGPERRRSYHTLKVFEPASSSLEKDIMHKLITQNSQLRETFEKLINLGFVELVITSPASSIITYKIKHTIALIVRHQQRHVAQAKEVKDLYKELLNL